MPRTLVFDLDGTLVDTLPDLAASLSRLLAARALPLFALTEIRAMIGDGAAALVRRALAAHGREATSADIDDFLADYTANVAVRSRPFPAAAETLDQAAAAGWRLALCTNKPAAPTRALLAALGLLDRFHAIGAGDTFPTRKPDPAHLLGTVAAAGGEPARAIMVGDHHNDVAAATAANIPAIFALWGYGDPATAAQATASAATLADILPLAARLVPA